MLDTLERPDTRTEIVLDWDATPKCQSQHLLSPNSCTVDAKYVVIDGCEHMSVLWCEARYREFMKTADSRLHMTCLRLLIDCWKVHTL